MASFGISHNAFQATKGPLVNSHLLSNLQKRPGLGGEPGLNYGLDGRNFLLVNRDRRFADSNDVKDARGLENG